jgi:hypothetical protein
VFVYPLAVCNVAVSVVFDAYLIKKGQVHVVNVPLLLLVSLTVNWHYFLFTDNQHGVPVRSEA